MGTTRPAPAKRTLEYGVHGSDVKALQQRLAQLKYYPGPAGAVNRLCVVLESEWFSAADL